MAQQCDVEYFKFDTKYNDMRRTVGRLVAVRSQSNRGKVDRRRLRFIRVVPNAAVHAVELVRHILSVRTRRGCDSQIITLCVDSRELKFLRRTIQNSFVDMENMFDLLKEEPEIADQPLALRLNVTRGLVEFRNVSFAYVPDRPVLKNVSFVVEPGKTVALVSESYRGKVGTNE